MGIRRPLDRDVECVMAVGLCLDCNVGPGALSGVC
jgi:hypothetical protein